FSATPTAGCAPFVSQFNAIAPAAAVVNYNWNFGDSTSASIANPSHNFTQKRNYSIRLSVTDTDGCVSSIAKNNYITTTNPTAQFENTAEICLGAAVRFTNRSNGNNLSSFWSFGDGNTSTASTPSHTYAAAGTYTVKLVVTTASGCSDSIVKTNTIRVVKLQASVANARITGFCAPALVTFQNTTPAATTFRWNFGDSSSSTLANPTHTYNKNGFFNVSLVVTNALGCSDTLKMDSMVRVVGPTPSFTLTQTQTCAPATVNFTNTSSNYRTALWDFRDGSLVRTNNASHIYTRAGSFNPILIVTDSLGCSASITSPQAVVVTGMPTASFGTNNRTVCAG
ncbi:MAG: PKD domain-containing protein, partial [Bacteroidia bacterium]